MIDAETKLDRYAIHEAGHITAAMALGAPCVYSWISLACEHVGGVAASGITNPQTKRERIAEIALLCAGRAAELLPTCDSFFAPDSRAQPQPVATNSDDSSGGAAWLPTFTTAPTLATVKTDRAQVSEIVKLMRRDRQTKRDEYFWWNRGITLADQILRNNRTLYRKVANVLRRDRVLLGRQLSELAELVVKV